jgi:hypothetical protein
MITKDRVVPALRPFAIMKMTALGFDVWVGLGFGAGLAADLRVESRSAATAIP